MELFAKILKRDDGTAAPTLPLINHLLDVYSAALHLWAKILPESLKNLIATDLDLSIEQSGEILAYFAGLHDLGKASDYFQKKILRKEDKYEGNQENHAITSARYLMALNVPLANTFAKYLAMHHGTVPSIVDLKSTNVNENAKILYQDYQNKISHIKLNNCNYSNEYPAWGLAFVGLVTLADWLVSQQKHWETQITEYENIKESQDRVEATILKANILPNAKINIDEENIVNQFFKDLATNGVFEARPLQSMINEKFSTDEQSLTIIEAPTGEGKTEAAFLLAGKHLINKVSGGIFVAMPTQATSNMTYERFNNFLANICPQIKDETERNIISSVLVHANAMHNEQFKQMLNLDAQINSEESNFQVSDWFTNKKLSLISQFGVGTVDQTLLSVLNVKHFFLRLFGLAGKTIIFDEVHAYDVCMEEIMKHLLAWLKALGSSVVILSATLPQNMKKEYLKAWGAESDNIIQEYPLITQAVAQEVKQETFEVMANKCERNITISFTNQSANISAIADEVVQSVVPGGRIAVIMNTVCRSQELYEIVKQKLDAQSIAHELTLFHARFMLRDRQDKEELVKKQFGKNAIDEPTKAKIVIATQVIEQSLDLDFDIMFSDFAPIDLLLQRAGRIHRHKRDNRPNSLKSPKFVLIVPNADEGTIPDFSPVHLGKIYEPYYLMLSYYKLRNISEWNFSNPNIYRNFVESVYCDNPDNSTMNEADRKRVEAAGKRLKSDKRNHARNIASSMISEVEEIKYMFRPDTLIEFAEDNTKKGPTAKTRCSDDNSRKYILLFSDSKELYFDAKLSEHVDFNLVKHDYDEYLKNSLQVYYDIEDDDNIETEIIPTHILKLFTGYKFIIYNINNLDDNKIKYDSNSGLKRNNCAK